MAFAKVVRVRQDAQFFLVAAKPVSEPRNNFVKDQDDAAFVAEASQGRDELDPGQDAANIVRDGFQDDGGDLIVPAPQLYLLPRRCR